MIFSYSCYASRLNLWLTKPIVYYSLTQIIGLLMLLPRLDGSAYFPGKYLWAEDGKIFLNQAQELGGSAIFTPYAGYLHVYLRLVAALASELPLIYQPLILLLGWLVTYLLMVFLIAYVAKNKHINLASSGILIALIAMQPNYGEVFFNITNSQWLLGLSLSLLVLVSVACDNKQCCLSKVVLTGLLALTGVFSIVLAPLVFIKLVILRSWKADKYVYLALFIGAFIQCLFMVGSQRATSGEIHSLPWNWLFPFIQLMFFNAKDLSNFIAAGLFWWLGLRVIRSEWRQGLDQDRVEYGLLLMAALMLLLASLYASKVDPSLIVALGGGNRYTWVPFALLFMGVFFYSRAYRRLHWILIGVMGFIGVTNRHAVVYPNLQFPSFAKWAEVKSVIIPINPVWPKFPSWHIKAIATLPEPVAIRVDLNKNSLALNQLIVHEDQSLLSLEAVASDPYLIVKAPLACPEARDIGVEIELNRTTDGWTQLFWGQDWGFAEDRSLRRWYPAGTVQAQFAFPVSTPATYIRFDPLETLGAVNISALKVYCLK